MLFSTAVQRLLEDGHDIFLEISPHPILLSSIQQEFRHAGKEGAMLPSLRREEEEHTVMLGSLGGLYTLGHRGGLEPHLSGRWAVRSLPFYPWQRERCWLDEPAGDIGDQSQHNSRDKAAKHSLLGRHFKSAHPAETHFWEVTLDEESRCLISMTIASKGLRCCRPRSMWSWLWLPRLRRSRHNPLC